MKYLSLETWLLRSLDSCLALLRLGLFLPALFCLTVSLRADPGGAEAELEDLMDMSLEELMDLDVSIVSRRARKFSDLPAAVYVLTGDEIRRAGHSSIPEALRMVPGFHVSRWTTNAWDVTSRGYGTGVSLTSLAYLNQLLVMIDGVLVYTPLFAGVWWPLQDLDLGDVDRIEIVRGPAGVLWGSNAVHGIVHIITKDSVDTQGFRGFARGGTDDRHFSARVGGVLGENTTFRVWGKFAEYDTLHNPFLDIDARSDLGSAGFRIDWAPESGKRATIWGRGYDGAYEDIAFDLVTFVPFEGRSDKDGYQIFASLEDPATASKWQAWYSLDRQDYVTFADIRIDTFDLEYHRRFSLTETNTLTAGIGYRVINSRLQGDDPFYLDFDPTSFSQTNPRLFVVDTVRFTKAKVELDVGLQLEDNEFTGSEVQPTIRASWKPRKDWTVWGGISRAVRTPSLEERTLSDLSVQIGNDAFRSEEIRTTELGLRKTFGSTAVLDLALFRNNYDHLSFARDVGFGQVELNNGAEGESYGAELAVDVRPSSRWQLRSSYSYIYDDFDRKSNGEDLLAGSYSPNHLFNLRSYYQLSRDWELDAAVYVVEGLDPGFDQAEYVRTDLRLGWQMTEELALAFGVQDLAHDTRSELDQFDNPRRAFYVSLAFEPRNP